MATRAIAIVGRPRLSHQLNQLGITHSAAFTGERAACYLKALRKRAT